MNEYVKKTGPMFEGTKGDRAMKELEEAVANAVGSLDELCEAAELGADDWTPLTDVELGGEPLPSDAEAPELPDDEEDGDPLQEVNSAMASLEFHVIATAAKLGVGSLDVARCVYRNMKRISKQSRLQDADYRRLARMRGCD